MPNKNPESSPIVIRVEDVIFGFGPVLKRFRENEGLNQVELGELAGITSSYITRLEKGGRCPSYEITQQISEALYLPDNPSDGREVTLYFSAGYVPPRIRENPALLDYVQIKPSLGRRILDRIEFALSRPGLDFLQRLQLVRNIEDVLYLEILELRGMEGLEAMERGFQEFLRSGHR